jgi:hypothetical protein
MATTCRKIIHCRTGQTRFACPDDQWQEARTKFYALGTLKDEPFPFGHSMFTSPAGYGCIPADDAGRPVFSPEYQKSAKRMIASAMRKHRHSLQDWREGRIHHPSTLHDRECAAFNARDVARYLSAHGFRFGKEASSFAPGYAAILAKSRKIGAPTHYVRDLTFHDRRFLAANPDAPFVWIPRECGTSVCLVTTDPIDGAGHRSWNMPEWCKESAIGFYVWDGYKLRRYASARECSDKVYEMAHELAARAAEKAA